MKRIVALLMTVMGMASAMAAEQIPADVRAAVNDYTSAMQKSGVGSAAKYMHPEALDQFKQMILGSMTATGFGAAEVRRTFGESATVDSVRAMPAGEFMEKLFANSQANDLMKHLLSNEIIGAVREGELWHVITRSRVEVAGSRMTTISVTTLKRDGSAWKALLASTSEPIPGANSSDVDKTALPPPPPPPPPPPRSAPARN